MPDVQPPVMFDGENSPPQPNYLREFPEFTGVEPPDLPPDFEDWSWHNDATPSWGSETRRCRLFVYHPDPAEREPGMDFRYVLVVERDDEEWDELALTDDWNEVVAALPPLHGEQQATP